MVILKELWMEFVISKGGFLVDLVESLWGWFQ